MPASLPPTDSLAGRGAVAPTRLLTDAELSQLAGYPDEIASEDLATFFRLDGEDRRWVVEDHRGPSNQLGLALQLCTLPWLGFVPDELTAAPAAAVSRLADQLAVNPGALAGYGGWKNRTRTEHLRQVLARLGWATARPGALKVLDDFLLARALEHDSPALLTQLAGEHLRAERVVRPAPGELLRRVTTARARAGAETAHRLAPLLAADRSAELDRLLAVDPDVGVSRLVWLRRGATSATADVIKTELDKLSFLRALDADTLDLSVLPPARRRFLAQLGRRSTAQALARSDPDRRHPILLATLAETAVEILDELVTLFDQALAVADSRARHQLADRLADQARAGADREQLLDSLLDVLADPDVADEAVGGLLRGGIGWERLRAARRTASARPPRDHGHLELLGARYNHLRAFTPAVLAALPLAGSPDAATLLTALDVLRELNATGRRRVPADAPADFVPIRWQGYLTASEADGRAADYRHYWELSLLYRLQAALRSGDVWVRGSRRYADPASYLIPAESWPPLREEFCALTGTSRYARDQLARLGGELTGALGALEPILAGSNGQARLDDVGHLVVSPLPAEQLPAGATALRDTAAGLLPRVDLASLLIEVDGWTGFTDTLTHAGGASSRAPELRRNLYAAILAQACNLGVGGMADASGISEDSLAWTSQWYLREQTLREANTVLVNRHHREPLAALWGGGTLSSSDGQRFPQRGKSLTARALSRYFLDEGTTTYTHVADQHSTYGTKVISSTVREATYVLDEILGNPTDLPIAEHAVDTHGQTFAAFAAFDLLGLHLSPRIRDLASLQLYRLGPAAEQAAYPHAGPLLTRRLQTELIESQWDQLLRLAGSLKFGHASASLLIAKLQAGERQNTLTRALIEYGRLVRTTFVLRYLADEALQRRVHQQLNKGESLHALRRRLFFAHEGHVRRRHHGEQTEQALCLTLVTNAVVLFNTVYLQKVLGALRQDGHDVGDQAAAHLSPALHQHINFYGSYSFDVERELNRTGLRPLRDPPA